MMLAYRLVRLMEAHSEALVSSLIDRVAGSERCAAYRLVPAEDFKQAVREVYLHLGEWLLGKTEVDIERRYHAIGVSRAGQRVPVSQLIWVIALMKENLIDFLQREVKVETAGEMLGELRVMQLMEQFFDRGAYYAALGHEQARKSMAAAAGRN